jgi:short-subunit dehydrogenase
VALADPEDFRAVVTGASSGIGRAFARALHSRGHRLVLVARRADRLEALAAELGGPVAVATLPIDLSARDAGEQVAAEAAAHGWTVDLLVNNAGLGHTGRFHQGPPERHLSIVDVNVRAAVDLTRRFLPGMVERRRGAVINVVSMSAFQPVPYLATYAASKAFLLSFSESVAAEVAGSGVTVQALCPGNIPTEFQAVAGTDRVPFNRTPATPAEDVVQASLEALDDRRVVVVPGLRDRVSVRMQPFLPRALVRRIAGELFRPQPDKG